jgi:Fur family peroxide stress response transcriptional regulator
MASPKTRLDQMITKLRQRENRITPQRLSILKILAFSDGHPSVETIYKKVRQDFPTTSLATVYKTLIVMKEIGEVLELGFGDGSNRYDGNRPFPHPHLICTTCGDIMDPDLGALDDMAEELARETGFKIMSHRLDFFGICPQCQQIE